MSRRGRPGSPVRLLALDWLGWGAAERRTDLRFDYDIEIDRLGRVLDVLDIDARNLVGHDYRGVRRLAILNSRAHRTFVPAWYAVF